MKESQSYLEHLVVHGGVASCSSRSNLGAVGGHSIIVAFSAREVVGHLGVELFDGLLLLTLAATATTTASTCTFTTSLASSRSGFVGGSRLGLVLLRLSGAVSFRSINKNTGNLRDTVYEGRLLGRGGDVCGADEKVNTEWAVVNLDAVESSGGLGSLLRPVEDDSRATEALAVWSVLHKDLLGPANADGRGKVVLEGVLVVVVG